MLLVATDNSTITLNLWTVALVLVIVATIVFILRNIRR